MNCPHWHARLVEFYRNQPRANLMKFIKQKSYLNTSHLGLLFHISRGKYNKYFRRLLRNSTTLQRHHQHQPWRRLISDYLGVQAILQWEYRQFHPLNIVVGKIIKVQRCCCTRRDKIIFDLRPPSHYVFRTRVLISFNLIVFWAYSAGNNHQIIMIPDWYHLTFQVY